MAWIEGNPQHSHAGMILALRNAQSIAGIESAPRVVRKSRYDFDVVTAANQLTRERESFKGRFGVKELRQEKYAHPLLLAPHGAPDVICVAHDETHDFLRNVWHRVVLDDAQCAVRPSPLRFKNGKTLGDPIR